MGREIEQRIRTEVTANNASRADVIDNLLAERLVTDLKDSFALTKAEIMRRGQYFRKHKSATFLLPVYYLDRRTEMPHTRNVPIFPKTCHLQQVTSEHLCVKMEVTEWMKGVSAMKIKSFLCALVLTVCLLPAALCAAEITDEDMALGGIHIGDTIWEVQQRYGEGEHVADGVDIDGEDTVGICAYDYGRSLIVEYRKDPDVYRVTSVHLGVNDVNKYILTPTEDARRIETPRGIHLDSTAEDLAEAYGYLPKPKCSHNAPPVCGYFYDGETAQLAFYICAEHSPGIRSIWLRAKKKHR